MQFAGLNTANNLSFYAVPAAWALSFLPHVHALLLVNLNHSAGTEGFNFSNPKKTRETIGEKGLTPKQQDEYLRAEAANDNSFVALPFFAAAIVAGNLARLPTATLNRAAGLYLVSRAAFNLLYIYGDNNALGLARTLAWVAGAFTSINLFVQAGKRFSLPAALP